MKQIITLLLSLLPFCAFSQISETFNGNQLDSNYPWRVDSTGFFLNNEKLCLDITKTKPGTHRIKLDIPYSASMEWQVDCGYNYQLTTLNHGRIYVYSTQKPSYEAYYIQIGYNTTHNVSLYKLDANNNPILLIKGESSRVTETTGGIRIKLTLENNEKWCLYSQLPSEKYFKKEGEHSSALKDIKESGVYTIQCKYQSSSAVKKIISFDNVVINNYVSATPLAPEGGDNNEGGDNDGSNNQDLPKLTDVQLYSLSGLTFHFNNAVDISQAVFSISGIGTGVSKYLDMETKKDILVLFEKEMEEGIEYVVSFKNIRSTDGREIAAEDINVIIESENEDGEDSNIPIVKKGSIIINEIMANPKGLTAFPETEYIELHNTTEMPIDLSGCYLLYKKQHQLKGLTLPAKGFAVLYRAGREIKVDNGGLAFPMDSFPSSLLNTGMDLKLLDSYKETIDEIIYKEATPAKAWERKNNDLLLSTDSRGGTPGSENSVSSSSPTPPTPPDTPQLPEAAQPEPSEIIINEILPEPYLGADEYIEIYNRSEKNISLAHLGIALRRSDGSLYSRCPFKGEELFLKPDDHVLLFKGTCDISDYYSVPNEALCVENSKVPLLSNLESTIVLYRIEDEEVIDEVKYSSKWHASSIKNHKGVALERIDPDKASNEASNWTSASEFAGFGTPAAKNSQYKNSDIGGSTGIDAPEWREESKDYIIKYLIENPGSSCRMYIFNQSGQKVKTIAEHQLLGTNGELIWDGFSQNGSSLSPGIYIFFAEIYHESGEIKKIKKAFILR